MGAEMRRLDQQAAEVMIARPLPWHDSCAAANPVVHLYERARVYGSEATVLCERPIKTCEVRFAFEDEGKPRNERSE
jgi:hypothetical protein